MTSYGLSPYEIVQYLEGGVYVPAPQGIVGNQFTPTDLIVYWIELLPQSKMKPKIMNFLRPNRKESIHHANLGKVLFK